MVGLIVGAVVLIGAVAAALFIFKRPAPKVQNFAPVIESAKAPMGFAWERTGMFSPEHTGYISRTRAQSLRTTAAKDLPAAPAPAGVPLPTGLAVLPTAAPVVITAFDTSALKPSEVDGIKEADYTGLLWEGSAGVPKDASGKITFASAADRADFVPVWSNVSDDTAFEGENN